MGLSGLVNHPTVDDIKTMLDHGEFDEALIMIEQSDENEIELQLLRSTILYWKGNTSRALVDSQKALDESRKGSNKIYLMNAILHHTHYSLIGTPEQHTIDQSIAEFNEIWNKLHASEKVNEEIREIKAYYHFVLGLRNGLFGQEDNDNILIEMNKGIEIQKKLKHKFRLFSSLNNLSVLCGAMGVYEKVLEIGREQQDLAEKLNNKRGMSGAYSNFAWYYSLIGNYEKMEEFTSKKMELDKENNDRLGLSLCYYYIGMVAFLKGENDEALRAMSRSLEFAQDLNHSTAIASRLFNLILISLELNSETLVNSYMGMLQELDDTTNLLRVSTFTNLAQALIHKSKSRAKDKTEAQKLLTQIIYGNLHQSIPFNFTLLAMLHLSELLLDELRTYGNDEVLKEVDDLTRKIYEMAQERQLVYEIIHILILQSKLAFLGLELDKANKILQQAHLIAEERSLDHLLPTIESEEKKLEEEIGLALEISKLATPMRERLEKSKIVNYLIEMQNLINARNE